jgi:deoxyhypusine synthase
MVLSRSILKSEVKDLKIKKNESVKELVNSFETVGGFTAANVFQGVKILREMIADEKCTKILSFPADLISTGVRGVFADSIKNFNAVITTCGTLDHDLARAWGGKYYSGSFDFNDAELKRIGVFRLGNVLIPSEDYGVVLEKNMKPVLEELVRIKNEWSTWELVREFGRRIKDENSIIRQAYLHDVLVFVPGVTDGAFGTQLTLFSQDHDFKVNVLKDERELSRVVLESKKLGALMIGGGISKHHTIWWSQFKGGLDYAVYVTTASQYDGSLSGARLSEAVSWGKVKVKAKFVNIDGDASVILPLMLAGL